VAARDGDRRPPSCTMNVPFRPVLALLAAALAPACSTDERPAQWSYIHAAIIRPSCATASCHSYAASVGGIDLSTPASAYTLLTGRVCGAPDHDGDAPGSFVTPGDPAASRLMHLLRGDRTYVMPPDVPLPPSEIDLIAEWILEGATCDTSE
jgi:hypothetical protein